MSEFGFQDRFRDLSSLDFDTDFDSETRLEPRVSVFRFRDERTGNLCSLYVAFIKSMHATKAEGHFICVIFVFLLSDSCLMMAKIHFTLYLRASLTISVKSKNQGGSNYEGRTIINCYQIPL